MANQGLREMADLLERIVPLMQEAENSTERLTQFATISSPATEQAIRSANELLGGARVGGGGSAGGSAGFGGIQQVGTSEGEARIVRTLEDGFRLINNTISTQGGETQAAIFSIGGF